MGPALTDLIAARFDEETATRGDSAFLRQMLTRRSIRAFADRPVPDALVRTLLAGGLSAPSKSDLQQVSVIWLRDPAQREALTALVPQFPWLRTAPVLLVFCGDGRRIRSLAAARARPFANDHLDSFMNAAVDAGIALASSLYVAESLGLGGCPISEIRNRIDEVSTLLALPAQVFPLAALCLGWPAEDPPLRQRLPTAVTLHQDRYDDSDLLAAVERYDAARAAAAPVEPEQQRDPARWGRADLYGWSEDRCRQYAVPARRDWGAYIRRQGFDLS
ncbi:MAG: hypothetical protein Kilf2KO_26640 [Rhodospirillales bacterium]